MALLVHLDWEDTPIDAAVFVFTDGAPEAFVQQANAIVENVRETDEQRKIEAPRLEVERELVEIDAPLGLAVGADLDVTLVVDSKIGLAPTFDLVTLDGVFDREAHS